MCSEKRKKNALKELSKLKSIFKVDRDVLMKGVQERSTAVVPEHCGEKTQCAAKNENDNMKIKTY